MMLLLGFIENLPQWAAWVQEHPLRACLVVTGVVFVIIRGTKF
jgi:hypothetical protein